MFGDPVGRRLRGWTDGCRSMVGGAPATWAGARVRRRGATGGTAGRGAAARGGAGPRAGGRRDDATTRINVRLPEQLPPALIAAIAAHQLGVGQVGACAAPTTPQRAHTPSASRLRRKPPPASTSPRPEIPDSPGRLCRAVGSGVHARRWRTSGCRWAWARSTWTDRARRLFDALHRYGRG